MELFKQYVDVSKEIETLEAKREVLRDDIAKALPEEGYKDEQVTAFWKTTKKWKYSPKYETNHNSNR